VVTLEERDQVVTKYCVISSDMASSIVQRCDILLDEANDLFNAEQKTSIGHIHRVIQQFLVHVKQIHQFTMARGWSSMESKEFADIVDASFGNDLRSPLMTAHGFIQYFLTGKEGPLTERQQEDLEYLDRLGQDLLTATIEFRKLLGRA
jgi:hypothetical protein